MKDFKKERSKKKEVNQSKKSVVGNKSISKNISTTVVFIVVLLAIVSTVIITIRICKNFYKSNEENAKTASIEFEQAGEGENIAKSGRERDYNDTYLNGAISMSNLLFLQNNVYQLYKSDDITKEQAEEYFSVSDNIVNLALSDSEIPDEEIEKYDDIIKGIPFINYELFQFKSSGDNVKKGIKGWAKAKAYWQIVSFYQEKIPEEKYNTFKMIVGLNLNHYEEENDTKVIEYGEKLIETYIGDVKEMLTSNEWKNDISTE